MREGHQQTTYHETGGWVSAAILTTTKDIESHIVITTSVAPLELKLAAGAETRTNRPTEQQCRVCCRPHRNCDLEWQVALVCRPRKETMVQNALLSS